MTDRFIVYSAKMRDGTYRMVEAVSWKDCKKYLGREAVSIRKRIVTSEELMDGLVSKKARQLIYERPHRRDG